MTLQEWIRSAFDRMEEKSPQQLRKMIESIQFTDEFIHKSVTEPKELPYGKNILLKTDEIEVAVIHLPAYGETFVHDHGESIGCAMVLEGEMINTEYELNERGIPSVMCERRIGKQGFLYATKHQIHKMSNPNRSRAVSFHIYTPNLNGSRKYEMAEALVWSI